MKKVFGIIGGSILAVIVCVGIAVGFGFLDIGWTNSMGVNIAVAHQNADTKVFHNTQGYVDGAVSDISKVKLEYDKSTDDAAKKALISYISSTYANLDPTQINNATIASWLRNIQNGTIN